MEQPEGTPKRALDAPRRRGPGSVGAGLAALALLSLFLGTAVYLWDRPAGSVVGLPAGASLHRPGQLLFGRLGGSLPSLAHAFAFTTLTALAAGLTRAGIRRSCVLWLAIESLFEIGQHPDVARRLTSALAPVLDAVPGVAHVERYFRLGRFDPIDVVAGAAGCLAAAWLMGRATADLPPINRSATQAVQAGGRPDDGGGPAP